MAYPVSTLIRPSSLNGTTNGKLPASVLIATTGQAGGATVTLCRPAYRGWRALCAAARSAGHVLKTNTPSSSYRTYAQQVATFTDHYTLTYLPGRSTKYWNGRTWYLRPGKPVAAVPGYSNHGWALAVDCGEERDADLGAEPFDDPTLDWLIANEWRFGFSHEIQSEPWHIRYFAGDAIPAAVLAYERTLKPTIEPTPEPPADGGSTVEVVLVLDTNLKYAIMPDGVVLLTDPEYLDLTRGGAHVTTITKDSLFVKLHSGPRRKSFNDPPLMA